MTEPSELTDRMRQSASGSRCEACMFEGKVETANYDGSPIVRCVGCGREVCDRHTLAEGVAADRRHGIGQHSRRRELEPA